MSRLKVFAIAAVAVAALTVGLSVSNKGAEADLDPGQSPNVAVIENGGLDHFKCYFAASDLTAGEIPHMPRFLTLTDQFGTGNAIAISPMLVCNPVDKNNEGITNPTAHLTGYFLRESGPQYGFRPDRVLIENQFGQQTLSIMSPVALLVPSLKYEEEPDLDAATISNGLLSLDHFKCYMVTTTEFFPRKFVLLSDQFYNTIGYVYRPFLLCNPAEKEENGAAGYSADQADLTVNQAIDQGQAHDHLVCYTLREFMPWWRVLPRAVFMENQFGMHALRALLPVFLCVPSSKTVPDGEDDLQPLSQ